MRRSTGALVIGLTLLIPATTALALGFGRIGHSTLLGQQLDFSVVLTTDGSELLNPQCVTAEVLVGDNPLPSTQVRSRVDMPADGGPALLRVVTNVRIDEPVASINVSVGCPPRLSRKFVVFIDPPVLAAPPTVAATPAAALAASGTPETPPAGLPVPPSTAVAPPLAQGGSGGGETAAAARRPASAAKPRSSRPPPLAQQTAPGSAARSAAAAVPPRRVPLAAVRPARSTSTTRGASTAAAPRLKLEADWQPYRGVAAAAAETEQRLQLPLAAAAAAASVAGAPSDEQQRIRQLEQSIGKLLADARTTQASLAELKGRLRDAESARFFNPWTYLLLALVAALLAAVLLLLWRQSRLKRESAWWAGGSEADATVAAVTPAEPEPDPAPSPTLAFADEPAPPPVAVPAAPVARPPAIDPPQRFVVAGPPEADAATPPFDPFATSTVAMLRDMSVEELIDMEQQAEFFVVLGQDDAAIELLMSHVRHGGSTSPLAFLKLLEIYRRRDERAPYERVRERFNRRFNAAAPEWDAAPGAAGRQLEDYPKVAASVEAVWPDPVQAMVLLESLLFRRDASAGTFDLPAYGELLFLYSQARDIAEHDVPTDTVDLLLPIGEEAPPLVPPPPPPTSHQPSTVPLQGPTLLLQAMSLEAPPSVAQQPVGIDFDLDDFDAPAVRR